MLLLLLTLIFLLLLLINPHKLRQLILKMLDGSVLLQQTKLQDISDQKFKVPPFLSKRSTGDQFPISDDALQQISHKIFMAKYFARVIAVACACLAYTAVNNANLGIISQLAQQNDNHWIGPLSIGLIFLGSGLGAIYNKYIEKYPYNRIIFVGAIGWDVYISFSVLFLFIGFSNWVNFVIVTGSLICGLTVSLFYNGIFNYINECGCRDNRIEKYFGFALCINQAANLLGGGLSSLLIQPMGQQNYSLLMLGISIAASISFLFFKEFDGRLKKDRQDRDASCLSQDLAESQSDEAPSSSKNIPLLMLFCFGLSGVMINFIFGQFSLLFYKYYSFMEKEELNHLTFVALMIEGSGECIGGLALALFSKKIKNISLAYTINGIVFLAAVVILYIGFDSDSLPIIYIASFIIGFCDCFCFSMAASIGGYWKQSGISLFNTGQSVTVALLSVPTIFFDLPVMFCIYIFLFLLSSLTLWSNRHLIRQVQQGAAPL